MSIKITRNYHHFREDLILKNDRVALIEKKVVDILLKSKIKDKDRESSIAFELKHSSAIAQFSRLMARKRNLDIELCAIGAVLHDIYVISTGKYKNHAVLGGEMAQDIMESAGRFSSEELSIVDSIIVNHSDKHKWTADVYTEFGKDVDVLDCFLYPNAIEYYLKHKPLPIMKEYLKRAQIIWNDLGVPLDSTLKILDNYHAGWLNQSVDSTYEAICYFVEILESHVPDENMPTLFAANLFEKPTVHFNNEVLIKYMDSPLSSSELKKALDVLIEQKVNISPSSFLFADNSDYQGFISWSSVKMIQPLTYVDIVKKSKELI